MQNRRKGGAKDDPLRLDSYAGRQTKLDAEGGGYFEAAAA